MRTVFQLATSVQLLAVLLLVWPMVARAQSASEAETLFQQGRAALDEGRLETACDHFRRSQALEPRVGTLLNLGHCLERRRLYASAAGTFGEASQLAARVEDHERLDFAQAEAKRLDEMSPRLTINAPNRNAGARIELDGDELADGRLGVPLRLDPGPHNVRVEGPGEYRRQHTVVLSGPKNGQRPMWVELVIWSALAPDATAAPPQAQTLPPQLPAPTSTTAPHEQGDAGSARQISTETLSTPHTPWQWIGAGTLTLGVASVVGATLYGDAAMTAARRADCDADNRCSADGLAARSRAREQLAVSYAVGIAGGAIALGGLALVLWSPESTPRPGTNVGLHLGPSSAGLFGTF